MFGRHELPLVSAGALPPAWLWGTCVYLLVIALTWTCSSWLLVRLRSRLRRGPQTAKISI